MLDPKKAVILVFALLGVGACQTRDARLALDADTLGAIDRMTAARCERANACGVVDPTCFEDLRVKTATELELSRCVTDVRPDVLDTCVRQIRRQACDDDHPVILLRACRVGAICVSAPEEGTT